MYYDVYLVPGRRGLPVKHLMLFSDDHRPEVISASPWSNAANALRESGEFVEMPARDGGLIFTRSQPY